MKKPRTSNESADLAENPNFGLIPAIEGAMDQARREAIEEVISFISADNKWSKKIRHALLKVKKNEKTV